jgi:hypothetical protein
MHGKEGFYKEKEWQIEKDRDNKDLKKRKTNWQREMGRQTGRQTDKD